MSVQIKNNNIKINRRELSGSLADIGVFLPLALSLISFNGLNAVSVFAISGLLYIASGLYFKHPVPVQPLKALAVTSLAMGSSPDTIASAAILMGIFLFIFYFTEMSDFFGSIFTKSIIRGIQLGLGLILVKKGFGSLMSKEFLIDGGEFAMYIWGYSIPLSLIVGGGAMLFAIRFSDNKRIPASFFILGFGIIAGVLTMPHGFLSRNIETSPIPIPGLPDIANFIPALFLLVIPQIPLTVGNSLFASSDTAIKYFGERAKKTTPRALSLTLAVTNIFVGILGGMPLCHGAGGLTAHYRFGSKTAGSNIIIGILFVFISLLSCFFPITILYLIPISVLGAILIFTGLEHAMLVEDICQDRNALFVAVTTGSFAVVTSNLFTGFVVGLVVEFWLRKKVQKSKAVYVHRQK